MDRRETDVWLTHATRGEYSEYSVQVVEAANPGSPTRSVEVKEAIEGRSTRQAIFRGVRSRRLLRRFEFHDAGRTGFGAQASHSGLRF